MDGTIASTNRHVIIAFISDDAIFGAAKSAIKLSLGYEEIPDRNLVLLTYTTVSATF